MNLILVQISVARYRLILVSILELIAVELTAERSVTILATLMLASRSKHLREPTLLL